METRVELLGGEKSLTIDLPDFVRDLPTRDAIAPIRVKMEYDSGDYWHQFNTDERDSRFGDVGCIEIGFVKEDKSVSRWLQARRAYGKDVPGQEPGSYRCGLGEVHFIVRGGYEKGPDGPGFWVPEWCEYDIYIPDALSPYSVKATFVGSRDLFRESRCEAIDAMVKAAASGRSDRAATDKQEQDDSLVEDFVGFLRNQGVTLCSDCGQPDPQGQYMRNSSGTARCRTCCGRLGPLTES